MMSTLTRMWRRSWLLSAAIASICFASLGHTQAPPIPPGGPAGGFRGPQMPGMPGGFGGMPGGFGGMPGFGGPTFEYTCSGCGAVLGYGSFGIDKPNLANCPKCGARFGNTMAGQAANAQDRMNEARDRARGWNRTPGGIPNGGMPNGGIPNGGLPNSGMPVGGPPAAPAPPENGFDPPVNDNAGGFQPPATPFTPPATSPTVSPGSSTSSVPARSRLPLVAVVLLVAVVVLLGLAALAGGVIWMLCTAPSISPPQPAPRTVSRRRNPNEYEPI